MNLPFTEGGSNKRPAVRWANRGRGSRRRRWTARPRQAPLSLRVASSYLIGMSHQSSTFEQYLHRFFCCAQMCILMMRNISIFSPVESLNLTSDEEFSTSSWHPGSAVLELIVFAACQMARRSLTKCGSAHFKFTRTVKHNL